MTSRMMDVLVIGGGPAGSTAASLLACRGWEVALLEKEAHPRFHIGESLLPSNLPILERLGVLSSVKEIGQYKPGADFTCDDGSIQSFPFERALGDTPSHAFQVRRAEFDHLLFQNCISKGVNAFEERKVTHVEQVPGGYSIDCIDHEDTHYSLQARFVIDATGRDSYLARKNKWRRKNAHHASAAIFGHFKDVYRRDGDSEGNISLYWLDQGWIWMIPLPDGTTSIGAVCWPEYLRTRDTDLETFLRKTLARSPAAAKRMQNAVSVSPISATGNYSYKSSRLYGDGFLLVGDAYAFIDPVFSSGVYLAMNSAVECLPAVEAWLASDTIEYRQACRVYQKNIDSKISAFSWFIYRFTTPTMRDLFRNPRNDWQVEQAVISMLAGDGDGSPAIRNRLILFKLIYYMHRFRRMPESLRAWLVRRRNAKIHFTGETLNN